MAHQESGQTSMRDHNLLGDKAVVTHEEVDKIGALTEEEKVWLPKLFWSTSEALPPQSSSYKALSKPLQSPFEVLPSTSQVIWKPFESLSEVLSNNTRSSRRSWNGKSTASSCHSSFWSTWWITSTETTMQPHVFKVSKRISVSRVININSAFPSFLWHTSSLKCLQTCCWITLVDQVYISDSSLPHGGLSLHWHLKSALPVESLVSLSVHLCFSDLSACRFILGLVEAPFFAGVLFYLSSWYTKSELNLRMSIFYSGSLISGAFGSLIAAGILNGLNGKRGLAPWQWLYIIEGERYPYSIEGNMTDHWRCYYCGDWYYHHDCLTWFPTYLETSESGDETCWYVVGAIQLTS